MDTFSLEEGYEFSLKSLVKTMETTSPNPKKIELVSVSFNMNEEINGTTVNEEKIRELLKSSGLLNEDESWSEYEPILLIYKMSTLMLTFIELKITVLTIKIKLKIKFVIMPPKVAIPQKQYKNIII